MRGQCLVSNPLKLPSTAICSTQNFDRNQDGRRHHQHHRHRQHHRHITGGGYYGAPPIRVRIHTHRARPTDRPFASSVHGITTCFQPTHGPSRTRAHRRGSPFRTRRHGFPPRAQNVKNVHKTTENPTHTETHTCVALLSMVVDDSVEVVRVHSAVVPHYHSMVLSFTNVRRRRSANRQTVRYDARRGHATRDETSQEI